MDDLFSANLSDDLNAKALIDALTAELVEANKAYHELDNPIIPDDEFDRKLAQLRRLEVLYPQFKKVKSPTDTVGGQPSKGFQKVKHAEAMLSLDNAFESEDILDFEERIRRVLNLNKSVQLKYVAEPKIDGLAISLTYKKGILVQAATRGGGVEGEDVTENVYKIDSIPKNLVDFPIDFIEVRGEVFMNRNDFDELNYELQKLIDFANKKEINPIKLYINPRNAAAGTLRQKTVETEKKTKARKKEKEKTKARYWVKKQWANKQLETLKGRLSFFCHGWGGVSNPFAESQWSALNLLNKFGIPVVKERQLCQSVDDIFDYYEKIIKQRPYFSYEIDGIAVKLDDLNLHSRLGSSSTSPRWAIAYKLPPEKVWTVLKDIDIQVGRTGTLSPVGKLKPVYVGGVYVSNVTLHNEDYITGISSDSQSIRKGKDIRVGDTVEIYRSGDVIPKVSDVDLSKRPEDSVPFKFPSTCPVCGNKAIRLEGDSVTRCVGEFDCRAQVLGRIQYFVSSEGLNFDGLGANLIEQFYDRKFPTSNRRWIENPGDIFKLKSELEKAEIDLIQEKGWEEKSVQGLFAEIEKKREVQLDRLLTALGIRYLGVQTAQRLAQHFQSWNNFANTFLSDTQEETTIVNDLCSIDGFGEVMVTSIIQTFKNPTFKKWLDNLMPELLVQDVEGVQKTDSVLSGLGIVFSGKLEQMTRSEAKIKAEALGARIYNSVGKNVDLVVAGPGSRKKSKDAEALKIKIISEDIWLKMIS